MSYETIRKNYEKGLWNERLVRTAVRKGSIAKEQFKDITGNDYDTNQ